MEIGIKGLPKIEKTDVVKNYFDSLNNEPLYIVSIMKFNLSVCVTYIK